LRRITQPVEHILIDATDLFICEYNSDDHNISLSLDSLNQTAIDYIKTKQQQLMPATITLFFFSSPEKPIAFHKKLAGLRTIDYDIYSSYESINAHLDKENLFLQYAMLSADQERILHLKYLTDQKITFHPTRILSSNQDVIKLCKDNQMPIQVIPQLGSLSVKQQRNIVNKIQHQLTTLQQSNVILYLDIDRTLLNNRLADKTNKTCLHASQITLLQKITNLLSRHPHWKQRIQLYLFTARLKKDQLIDKTPYYCYPQDDPHSATKIIEKIKTNVPDMFEIVGTIYSEEHKHKKYKGDFLLNILELTKSEEYPIEYSLMLILLHCKLSKNDTLHLLIDDNKQQCLNFTSSLRQRYRKNNFFTAHIHGESNFTSIQPQQQPCKPVPVLRNTPHTPLFTKTPISSQTTKPSLNQQHGHTNHLMRT
jgi:hypothetical protein